MHSKFHQLADRLAKKHFLLATAESCTGGGIAKTATDISGSSAWFDCGFVTYSNRSKHAMLGVSEQTLQQYGAVSEETVTEMVRGIFQHSPVDCGIAVSGIAGPGGGTPEKPVGTVWIGVGLRNEQPYVKRYQFSGDRNAVRSQTIEQAVTDLLSILG